MQANDLRKGAAIVWNGQLYLVLESSHRTPGNKRAFMQVSMRDIKTGKIIQCRFSSAEEVEEAHLEAKQVQYLYHDHEGYHFMDLADFHNFYLTEEVVGDEKYYLKESDEIEIEFHDGKPVAINLPSHVLLKVTESPPGVKGDSVSNNTKPAVLETGLKIQVPIFVKEGEIIKVDTRTGQYLSRE